MDTLHGVLIPEIKMIWNKILPLISDACDYNGGRYTADDCLKEILLGQKQLWLIANENKVRGLVITGISNFPQMKCCMIDICTGEGLCDWVGLLPIIEDWALDNGCSQMSFAARPGMEKALKPFGYTKPHVMLEKTLIDKSLVRHQQERISSVH